MKKILVTLIIVTIIITSSTTAYSLQQFSDVENTKYEEAVAFLSAFEIIDGFPDGTFKPNDYITRAQMSRMLTVVLGYKEYSHNMTSTFKDMNRHWAEQYVEIMNALDIVQGYLDGTFGPDNYVTYSEAITMIVRSLGYTDRSLPGDWPYDYYVKAGELGIVDGVVLSSGNATRGDIAIMIYNAVNCYTVDVNNEDQIYINDKILLNKFGSKETKTITLEYLEKQSKIDIEKYLFNKADIYYNFDDEIIHIGNIKTKQYSGMVTTQLSNYKVFVTDENGNIKPFDLYKAPIYYNGAVGRLSSLLNTNITVVYDEDNRTNYIKGVIAKEVTDVLDVEEEDLYIDGNNKFMGKYLPLNKDKTPNYEKIIITGAANNLSDINQKDILYFYETDESFYSKSKLQIEVIRNKVIGKIERINYRNNKTKYTIDGIEYFISPHYVETEVIELGYEVEALLDKEDRIVRFYVNKYYNEPQTYGLVIGKTEGEISESTILPQIKILDQNGEINIYEIEENSDILIKDDNGFKTALNINLFENDIIKFDIQDNGKIKLIEKIQSENISSTYNSVTGYSHNKKINSDTIIFYKDRKQYKIIEKQQLSEFISANISYNYKGEIVAMYLIEGIKNTYSGELYTIIKEISQIQDNQGNTVGKVSSYTNDALYTLPDINKTLTDYKNQFVKITMDSGKILDIELVKAENTITEVEAIYSMLLKIEGTYYEISPNADIYISTIDEENNIDSAKRGTIKDIQIGDKVQFFDTTGDYEGIIDVIIVYRD